VASPRTTPRVRYDNLYVKYKILYVVYGMDQRSRGVRYDRYKVVGGRSD
jgi:hypothetical protein